MIVQSDLQTSSPVDACVRLGSPDDQQREHGGVHGGAVRQLLGPPAEPPVLQVLPEGSRVCRAQPKTSQ